VSSSTSLVKKNGYQIKEYNNELYIGSVAYINGLQNMGMVYKTPTDGSDVILKSWLYNIDDKGDGLGMGGWYDVLTVDGTDNISWADDSYVFKTATYAQFWRTNQDNEHFKYDISQLSNTTYSFWNVVGKRITISYGTSGLKVYKY